MKQQILALMSQGVLEPLGGRLGFPRNKLHPQKLGAAEDCRGCAGHYVLDVVRFAQEMPCRPKMEHTVRMMPRCAVNERGVLAWPLMAFSHLSEVKFRFTAPNTFHAGKAIMILLIRMEIMIA